MSVPNATEFACIVALMDMPADPSKLAVPTTSPESAIALAVASVVAVDAFPLSGPSKLATKVAAW